MADRALRPATPALGRRVSLIGRAKAIAPAVVTCVQNRLRPDHLLQGRSWDELAALVIVLAEAADPAVVKQVAEAPADDGRPDPEGREAMLRTAHSQANAYRQMSEPVPTRLAILDREYYRWRKREQRAAAEGRSNAA